jgi:glycine oxidase
MRVLVVGAGVIGAAVADALARRGADVTVLDMRSPGRGASQASAGILAPYIEAHQDSPLLQLGLRSLDLFDAFVAGASERSGRQVEYARTGTLEAALNEDDAARLKAAKAWLDSRGVANEWIDAAGVRSVEPAVTATSVGGLLVPKHGFVGVSSLIDALVHSARFGGAVFESPVEVVDIEPNLNGDQVLVRADARRYSADAVVVASGSWSGRVRIKGVSPLPVRPVRGQLLHLRWPGALPVGRIVWGPRCYTVPWSTGCSSARRSRRSASMSDRRSPASTI